MNTFQQEIIPVLQQEVGNFPPKLERLIQALQVARIEQNFRASPDYSEA